MSYKRVSKGFTLLELLIVITVTSLLAGSIVVSTTNSRQRSRDSKRKADLLAIQSALEVYFSQNKFYPTNCVAGNHNSSYPNGVNSSTAPSGLPPIVSKLIWPNLAQWINHVPRLGVNNCSTAGLPQFTTTYISALPQDPINSGEYVYRYRTNTPSGPATAYELDAKMEFDQKIMDSDGGGCPGSNGARPRYELFNLNGDTLLKTCTP